MSSSENIKNAFNVVRKTYENVDKLLKYCDSIANDNGYEAVTDKFLRYKSDSDYGGWLIDRFIKLYQFKTDKVLENDWKDGPVFAIELNFDDLPTVYLSKFEYDDISKWDKGAISPALYWIFSDPVDCEGNGFKEKDLGNKYGYRVSKPSEDIKNKYWGIKRIIYTTVDLIQLQSNNVPEKVFGEFDILKNL